MGELTSGWRRLLSLPAVYAGVQNALGGRRTHEVFANGYVRATAGDRVLDIGCGTGSVLEALPEVDYVGVDLSPEYIEQARERWGDRGRFVQADVHGGLAGVAGLEEGEFDLVISFGVLHHLDDRGARSLVATASRALRPNGALVTLDPVLERGQSRVARWLIGRDRGRHVRCEEAYERLAAEAFAAVTVDCRRDLLRLPYSHCIVRAERPLRG